MFKNVNFGRNWVVKIKPGSSEAAFHMKHIGTKSWQYLRYWHELRLSPTMRPFDYPYQMHFNWIQWDRDQKFLQAVSVISNKARPCARFGGRQNWRLVYIFVLEASYTANYYLLKAVKKKMCNIEQCGLGNHVPNVLGHGIVRILGCAFLLISGANFLN